jgi:hypothetical protein
MARLRGGGKPAGDVPRVYPALEQIGRYALSARTNRMSLLGVRRSRRIGTDNEFERLRDYSSDDQFKSIDWRATARRLKLTVRDHQSNQSQRIVFAIDSGRMMVNRTAGESLLDAALDAALTLAHVALRQRVSGDQGPPAALSLRTRAIPGMSRAARGLVEPRLTPKLYACILTVYGCFHRCIEQ